MSQRVPGILLHPTSLSNPYPIGDLGRNSTPPRVKAGTARIWNLLNKGAMPLQKVWSLIKPTQSEAQNE